MTQNGKTNPAAAVACCCLICCLNLFKRVMEMTNEMAYCDVVVQGTGYLKATRNVFKLIASHPADIATVQAMTKAIRFLGILCIGFGGTYLSYLCLTSETVHTHFDDLAPGSARMFYTENVFGPTIAAAVICFSIAASFMNAFSHVADALGYARILRNAKGEADPDDDAYQLQEQ